MSIATLPATDPALLEQHGWHRLPGLFHRHELTDVLEPGRNFHFEPAGNDGHGSQLFAVYHRDLDEGE